MKEKQNELSSEDFISFNDPIVTNHSYFMKKPIHTFLDEDAAVNVNNSEMTTSPNEYE